MTFPTRPAAPTTLEQAGILPGSRLLATPEEAAEQERVEAERIAQGNAELDSALAKAWACQCCGNGDAAFQPDGLCRQCRSVIARIRSEVAMTEIVNGKSRRQLAEEYVLRVAS
jgi:hypothetical protein